VGADVSTLTATNLRDLIADVAAFRTWIGVHLLNQEAARARVYIAGVDEGDYARPFALIVTEEQPTDRRVAGGSSDVHVEEGQLLVLFEDDTDPGAETMEEAEVAFTNDVGGILAGILALAGQPGYLSIVSLSQQRPPQRFQEDIGDDAYQALYAVEWGI
jgi:hypothetical protein